MNVSTAASPVPRYVELAPAASIPQPNTSGALLRDYLGILAFYFEHSGEPFSPAAVQAALSALPGLLLAGTVQAEKEVSLTPDSAAAGPAGAAANERGAEAGSSDLLSLARPMIANLNRMRSSASSAEPLCVTLIVLQRPADGVPTLGTVVFSLATQAGGGTDAAGTTPQQSLSVGYTRTEYTVSDQQLAELQLFVSGLRQKNSIADLGTTAGYVAIPLK